MELTDVDKAELLLLHATGMSFHSACEEFHQRHPSKRKPAITTLRRMRKRFLQTGSLRRRTQASGRRSVTTEELQRNVTMLVQSNPQISTRKLSQQLSTSRSSVQRVLHRLGYQPYKFFKVVALKEDDWQKRVDYCEWFRSRLEENPSMSSDIIYSDEAAFYIHGGVNKQNMVYWSKENPKVVMESHHSYNPKVLVWMGFHGTTLLGPYFFEGTVNGERYLDLLSGFLTEYLLSLDCTVRDRIYFQQDGASAHFSRPVRKWLDSNFGTRWIGRGGPIHWPPRSPDLTPLDFFLWNRLKSVVYSPQPRTLDKLKDNIKTAIRHIPLEEAANVHRSITRRVLKCIECDGRNFEHLL